MKELHCHKCSCFLGAIEKGKIKKGTVLLCSKCFEDYKILEDLGNYAKSTAKDLGKDLGIPDFLSDLLNGKKPK